MIYMELKALEEIKLSKNNERLILRVFLTGYYIRSQVFALAEFINSALEKNNYNKFGRYSKKKLWISRK